MTFPQSTSRTRPGAFVNLLATGSLSLIIAFVLWFALMSVDLVSFYLQISRHPHQAGYHAFSLVAAYWPTACCYACVFFLGAFGAARPRWSDWPGLSAFLAYGAFLAVYLPFLDWSRGFSVDAVGLFLPLITSPLGGFVGARVFAKRPRG